MRLVVMPFCWLNHSPVSAVKRCELSGFSSVVRLVVGWPVITKGVNSLALLVEEIKRLVQDKRVVTASAIGRAANRGVFMIAFLKSE